MTEQDVRREGEDGHEDGRRRPEVDAQGVQVLHALQARHFEATQPADETREVRLPRVELDHPDAVQHLGHHLRGTRRPSIELCLGEEKLVKKKKKLFFNFCFFKVIFADNNSNKYSIVLTRAVVQIMKEVTVRSHNCRYPVHYRKLNKQNNI